MSKLFKFPKVQNQCANIASTGITLDEGFKIVIKFSTDLPIFFALLFFEMNRYVLPVHATGALLQCRSGSNTMMWLFAIRALQITCLKLV
jgi:hypothetical protein